VSVELGGLSGEGGRANVDNNNLALSFPSDAKSRCSTSTNRAEVDTSG